MSEYIEQPLPSTFEEFNEQRKAAFIRVKDYKQAGNRLIGFCAAIRRSRLSMPRAPRAWLCAVRPMR